MPRIVSLDRSVNIKDGAWKQKLAHPTESNWKRRRMQRPAPLNCNLPPFKSSVPTKISSFYSQKSLCAKISPFCTYIYLQRCLVCVCPLPISRRAFFRERKWTDRLWCLFCRQKKKEKCIQKTQFSGKNIKKKKFRTLMCTVGEEGGIHPCLSKILPLSPPKTK